MKIHNSPPRRTIPLILLAALLAACSGITPQMRADFASPSWRDGHGEGCNAGYQDAGNLYVAVVKDPNRYAHDPAYQRGWDAGREECAADWRHRDAM